MNAQLAATPYTMGKLTNFSFIVALDIVLICTHLNDGFFLVCFDGTPS